MHGPADAELPFNRGPLSAHSRRLEYRFATKSAAVSFADPSGLYQLRAARYSRRTISNSSSAEVSGTTFALPGAALVTIGRTAGFAPNVSFETSPPNRE
jgi:hypothetical protein